MIEKRERERERERERVSESIVLAAWGKLQCDAALYYM